jgi:hypothetical protein
LLHCPTLWNCKFRQVQTHTQGTKSPGCTRA